MNLDDIKRIATVIHETRYQWNYGHPHCRYCGCSEGTGHADDCVSTVALRVLYELMRTELASPALLDPPAAPIDYQGDNHYED